MGSNITFNFGERLFTLNTTLSQAELDQIGGWLQALAIHAGSVESHRATLQELLAEVRGDRDRLKRELDEKIALVESERGEVRRLRHLLEVKGKEAEMYANEAREKGTTITNVEGCFFDLSELLDTLHTRGALPEEVTGELKRAVTEIKDLF